MDGTSGIDKILGFQIRIELLQDFYHTFASRTHNSLFSIENFLGFWSFLLILRKFIDFVPWLTNLNHEPHLVVDVSTVLDPINCREHFMRNVLKIVGLRNPRPRTSRTHHRPNTIRVTYEIGKTELDTNYEDLQLILLKKCWAGFRLGGFRLSRDVHKSSGGFQQ